MTDSIPLPPPTMPPPPATNKPFWKKKRFFIPTAVVVSLLAVGIVAPPVEEPADAITSDEVEVSTAQNLMPDVVGLNLQDAQDTIQETGVFFSRSEDATGEGRRQLVDRNWVVVAQNIEPGTPFGEGDVVLSVVKEDEERSATPQTTAPATTTADPAPPTTAASAPSVTTPASMPAPTTTVAPITTAPTRSSAAVGTAITITNVVDGDTVDISTGERVRILGYDTPERGECGYRDAANALGFILLGGNVTMTTDSGDDTDRYGRILRHVLVNGTPVGLTLIETGNANARYDSLDGYPRHRYQDQYRAADGPNTFVCTAPAPVAPAAPPAPAPAPAPTPAPAPAPSNNGPFKNCDAVRAAGRAPILVGEPGFESKFDRDGDGIGCE